MFLTEISPASVIEGLRRLPEDLSSLTTVGSIPARGNRIFHVRKPGLQITGSLSDETINRGLVCARAQFIKHAL